MKGLGLFVGGLVLGVMVSEWYTTRTYTKERKQSLRQVADDVMHLYEAMAQ